MRVRVRVCVFVFVRVRACVENPPKPSLSRSGVLEVDLQKGPPPPTHTLSPLLSPSQGNVVTPHTASIPQEEKGLRV